MERELIYFAVIAGVSICFSLIALVASLVSIAFVVGLKNSTHKIEWVPVDQGENSKFYQKESEEVLNET